MLEENEIRIRESYFRDPNTGERLLKPPISGTACRNIRIGLNMLGYNISSRSDRYDDQLVEVVRQFQIDHNHTSDDGYVGPGTRRLLVRVLVEEVGLRGFGHMEDPEEQLKKKILKPILRDIERKEELIEIYKGHLHVLEVQKAKFGVLNLPPHIQLGIDETKGMIEELRREISVLEEQL